MIIKICWVEGKIFNSCFQQHKPLFQPGPLSRILIVINHKLGNAESKSRLLQLICFSILLNCTSTPQYHVIWGFAHFAHSLIFLFFTGKFIEFAKYFTKKKILSLMAKFIKLLQRSGKVDNSIGPVFLIVFRVVYKHLLLLSRF